MARKLFSYDEVSNVSMTDKLHGLVSGANKIFSLQTLKNFIIGSFGDGEYFNPTITVANGRITNIQSSGIIPKFYVSSFSHDFPPVVAGGEAFIDISIPGVLPNDTVIVGLPQSFDTRFVAQAFVIAGGLVRLSIRNISNTTIDLPALSYKLRVLQ